MTARSYTRNYTNLTDAILTLLRITRLLIVAGLLHRHLLLILLKAILHGKGVLRGELLRQNKHAQARYADKSRGPNPLNDNFLRARNAFLR